MARGCSVTEAVNLAIDEAAENTDFINSCGSWEEENKKAVLSQGHRAMPQLFFSV